MSARAVMVTRSKSAFRGVLRRTGQSAARLVVNPELRRLLSPYLDLYGPSKSIEFGEFTYFKGPPRVHRYRPSDGPVTIGRYCSIADDVEFLIGGQHHLEFVTTYPLGGDNDDQYFSKGPIVIGNDVWIGRGAMITSGVTIGDGAVIGARSLVTK
ncbi:MAG: CatB-related O-acetyltransferase, partial [Ilumatobacteraceae bacterium]